jgi:ATP-dependent DNA helicase RecQ
MSQAVSTGETSNMAERIIATVKRYWGFDTLRPLQSEAILAGIEHRDSLVVLPTGGGKSLCYQVPPAIANRTDIVVSPLISLMKDQVDGLNSNGYPAAALHSGLSDQQRRDIERGISGGGGSGNGQCKYRLLFVAPERLLTPWFMQIVARLNVKAFAIDEAHCISQWGHDFRPEYRQLRTLKERFPAASVHAYTATATPRVQEDIVVQLGLESPNVLVGVFDRPNLAYRIVPRVHMEPQTLEVVRRHADEAVIVYCITRKDTEYMAEVLKANGVNAAAYHAGMEKHDRTRVQEQFAEEKLDVVVATVAFGMGIDRSNVRCVIHAAMPKTVEHYQQETGRAGRDGLEAECVMFYSYGDVMRWQGLIDLSAKNIEDPELRAAAVQAQRELLDHMQRLCGAAACRHRALSRYFGQEYQPASCGACDVCMGEIEGLVDASVIAQKILSCVARVEQRFGLGHVVDVLIGADTEMVRKCGHERLSTYGLLRDMDKKSLANLAFQLVDQGLLERTPGDRPLLKLNAASLEVMKGRRPVHLIEPKSAPVHRSTVEEQGWEGVDRGLFERLRQLRKQMAGERSVPAFVILSDAVLRELASVRPASKESFRRIHGIGEHKAAELAEPFIEVIGEYCKAQGLSHDNFKAASMVLPKRVSKPNGPKELAMQMFAQGQSMEAICAAAGRARNTVGQYLEEWIRRESPRDISSWVDEQTFERVRQASVNLEGRSMKPVFEALNGEVPYEIIRAVMAQLEAQASGV